MLNFKPKNSQDKRDLAIIELIYSSGLRVSEAVNSNLSDFEIRKLEEKEDRVSAIISHYEKMRLEEDRSKLNS